jgi:hypothetical protein
MVNLSRTTILIVDFAGACKLRERLVSSGASVHVVRAAGALVWARCKKIHAAFISLEDASIPLCEQLAALNVRPIIVTADDKAGVAAASASWRSILASKRARDIAAVRILPALAGVSVLPI